MISAGTLALVAVVVICAVAIGEAGTLLDEADDKSLLD